MAAISIAAAAFPAAGSAGQNACQPGPGPVGVDPSQAGGVNLHVTANNSVIWCSAQVIEANHDVQDGTTYQVRAAPQSPGSTPVSNAISVSALLTLAGVPPATVNHTEIARLNGASSTLDHADLTDPSARFSGGYVPIFWINGSETQYLRPLRSASDTNGNDQIVASSGAAIDFYVYSGPILNVTAIASPAKAAVRQSVTLTAHVSNATAGDGALSYSWNFTDGQKATGASVRHSYAVTGTWYPVVTVQGAGNDSGGVSPPVAITVGAPSANGSGGAPGSSKNKAARPGGPTASRGTTPRTAPSPKETTGAGADKTSRGKPGPTGSGRSARQDATPSHVTTPARTTPTLRAPRTHKTPIKPHRAAVKRRHSSSHQKTRTQHRPTAALVKGRLVSDVVPISSAQLARQNRTAGQQPSQAHAAPARFGGGSITPVTGIAGGCAIILLLGSGAGRELRSQRRAVDASRVA